MCDMAKTTPTSWVSVSIDSEASNGVFSILIKQVLAISFNNER